MISCPSDNNMVNSLSSSCPTAMLVFRLSSFLLLLVLVLYALATDKGYSFIYLTFYGILLTCILFGLILLQYKIERGMHFLAECITPVWLVNFFITVYYWVFLSGYLGSYDTIDIVANIFDHSVPFICSTVEILADQVKAKKIDSLYATLIITVYILLINLPYTLEEEEVYPDLNYTNLFTYLAAIGAIVFFVIFGFAMHYLKKKILENRNKVTSEQFII